MKFLHIEKLALDDLPEAIETKNYLSLDEKIIEELSRIRDINFEELSQSEGDFLMLDLLFLETAMLKRTDGGVSKCLGELENMIMVLAKKLGRIPALTYEDLIFLNSEVTTIRTFTKGKVRQSEMNFYKLHRDIEDVIAPLVSDLKKILEGFDRLSNDELDDAEQKLGESLSKFMDVPGLISRTYKEMPKEDFAVFRPFFTSHPTRNFKGPSGAFSGNIPLVEFLCFGSQLPDERFTYLSENLMYFPRDTQELLGKFAKNGPETVDLNSKVNKSAKGKFTTILQGIQAVLKTFRGVHYAAVKHHIPEALEGKITGTAGERDVAQFLKDRIRTT